MSLFIIVLVFFIPNPLPVRFAGIFSHSVDFFTLLMVSCEPQKLLIFSQSLVYTLFPLLANDFGFLRNCCLIQGHKD